MKYLAQIVFIILCTCYYNSTLSQSKEVKSEVDYNKSSLFDYNEPINMEIQVNEKALLKDVKEKPQNHHALIKYHDSIDGLKEFGFKISARGHFRKDPANCNLPPLKLKIPKNVTNSNGLFSGQDKLKMVVPCNPNSEKHQECLYLEYLVYQTYELVTSASYKTRLVNITLIDSLNLKQKRSFTGFFVEEDDQLASRNDGKILKFKRYHPGNVNREHMTLMSVFQYMIGNTDWSVDASHNIELLFIQDNAVPLVVPYDFDWAGIVNASYAVPAEVLNIKSVRQRVFRGFERSIDEYTPVIKLFNDRKEEIYKLYSNCSYLTEKTKIATFKYLDDFYEIINNPKSVEREFVKNCRKL